MKATTYICWECQTPIIQDRIDFLLESGIRPERFTCIKHASNSRIQGIYSGEVGTSPIIFCDKVYNDNIRSKFTNLDELIEETDDLPEEP